MEKYSKSYLSLLTTVVTGVGSSNPIAGEMSAIKTYGKRIDSMIVKTPVAIKFALGENPKLTYNEKGQMPSTRMATAALIREQLFKAKKYQEEKERAANASEDEDVSEPEFCMKCESLIPLLKGDIKAHFHAHRADDIFTAIRIATEFSLDYVIIHATEGHLIADDLKKEMCNVVLGPLIADRGKPELASMALDNAAILSKAGVRLAICTDHPENPIHSLSIAAAIAVREGMNYNDALKAITIIPAKICGIDDKVGSIKIGKDADFCVFKTDPLSILEKPTMVITAAT